MIDRDAQLKAATATAHTWQYVPEIADAVDAAFPEILGVSRWDWAVIVAYSRRPLETAQEAAQRISTRVALHAERWGSPMSPSALLVTPTTP